MKAVMPAQAQGGRRLAPRTPWLAALFGAAIGLLFALIVFAPATWLGAGLLKVTNGHVQLQDARGTVWNGSGRLLLTGGSGSKDKAVLPGLLAWELRPAWLGLTLKTDAACCTPLPLQARFSLGWNTLEFKIENGVSQWPAALMVGLGTPWNTVQADASLQLSTRDLVFKLFDGRLAVSGAAQLDALDVSSRLSKVSPMGSYQVAFTGGPAPTVKLTTLSGAFKLSGNGSWVGSRLRFNGLASVEPDMANAFSNLLNIIGRREGVQSIITLG